MELSMQEKIFLTIPQTAAVSNFPEFFIRQLQKQQKLPCIYAGRKCLVNYPQFIAMLDNASREAVQE